ncbi:hypothetical protein KQX54_006115 [Cotesia glomerata]|uniref:Uncharacterized protein n=1 Tax=Cotesia glomerata TaxID=32391 RepID=A0AAV7HSK4_COTGL|nr:hypothetical protein KQX54_006115 [Cotesia glomerata]
MINENTEYDDNLQFILRTLQKEEHDLYKEFAENVKEEKLLFSDLSNLLPTLRTNPEMILRNWEYSLKTCMESPKSLVMHEFIKSSRWYQDLPIKFTEECLKIIEEKRDAQALIVLALLLEGSAFEQVIPPFIPSSATIDIDPEDAKINYQMVHSASSAFNLVNPAVSLDCLLKFCVGDYIHSIINCLVNISRRTSVAKVIPFALKLMDRPVSIKKHGIRLFFFSTIFDAFKSNPNKGTWEMLKECMDGVKPGDREIYVIMLKFKDFVPNEYVADYVEKLFSVYRELSNIEAENFLFDWDYITNLLEMPNNISALFSEEQHKKIIDNYVLDLPLSMRALYRGNYYLINSYIVPARNKLEERLNHFRDIFTEIMKDINVPQPNCPTFYPANFFIHNLACNIFYYSPCDSWQERLVGILLESFSSLLKPHDDPEAFLYLTLFTLTKGEFSPQSLTCIINETLPEWIAIFSIEFISVIAEHLYNFLKAVYFNCHGPSLFYCLDVVEALLAFNADEASIFAANFLRLNAGLPNEEFSKMVNVLKNHRHPTVTSIAHVLMHRY